MFEPSSALFLQTGFGESQIRLLVDSNRLRETLINGPTSEVAGEMASNFLDDEANRRSIQ
ncbi:hypothetical protein [Burkholderia vietnamiensis]|uniref:hypothetical protein n=1 Tax=Burkholderia vietnamiensis TaxID=60552 RepID=UPI0015931AED|nr:hypothetical protein [Burkholderia vietnamiensis]